MRCVTLCLAQKIDMYALDRHCRGLGLTTQRFRDAIELHFPNNQTICHAFANGCLVIWGIKKHQVDEFVTLFLPFCAAPLPTIFSDSFLYYFGEKTQIKPHDYFNVEILTVEKNDPEQLIALAYAFSQSMRLGEYEHRMERLIAKHQPMYGELSQTGHLGLNREEVKKIIGEILSAKCDLNLNANFSYQPKFFWQHANLEPYYLMLARYLDLQQRTQVLNQQLEALNEIFYMLNSHLENKHSHFLEVVIILLIAMEIVISIFNLHL